MTDIKENNTMANKMTKKDYYNAFLAKYPLTEDEQKYNAAVDEKWNANEEISSMTANMSLEERFNFLANAVSLMRTINANVLGEVSDVDESLTEALEAIKNENLALQQEREWILDANDLDETMLEPSVICPKCGGSGYVQKIRRRIYSSRPSIQWMCRPS